MSCLKRCDETFRNLCSSKKRRSNEGFAIHEPQDSIGDTDSDTETILSDNVSDGARCEADSGASDSDTDTITTDTDSDFSEWFKNNHIRLYECINDELEERFLEKIKNDPDIFINDIEENMVTIVNNALAGSDSQSDDEISDSEIMSLLYTVLYNSIWMSNNGNDTDNEGAPLTVTDGDVEAIAKKTLEMINIKVEEQLNGNFF